MVRASFLNFFVRAVGSSRECSISARFFRSRLITDGRVLLFLLLIMIDQILFCMISST